MRYAIASKSPIDICDALEQLETNRQYDSACLTTECDFSLCSKLDVAAHQANML